MKRLLGLLLGAVLILASAATAWAFTDTAELNEAELLAVEKLSALDIIGGYPDGSFKPANPVSRAEFAKMLCMFAEQEQLIVSSMAFVDVPANAWYAGWVARAAQKEWISGYPGYEYRPQAQISQQEIATVLVRVRGLSQDGFVWPRDYITEAEQAGFFADIGFEAAAPASRVVACQMLYNALPPQQEQKPAITETLRGVITAISGQEITVLDAAGKSAVYQAGALLPSNLFPGAYVEAQIADNYLVQLGQVFNAKKENAWWDLALDGSTATIDGKKYNIEEAEIFVVNYTLSKPFSADTFISAGLIDRDILALGGRLAAEMAVVLEESGGVLKRAYVVNASVVISGGRLDVVEGAFNSSKGEGVSFLGRSGGLPLVSGVSMPSPGTFIHYDLKNGGISGWHELYYANARFLPDVSGILGSAGGDAPNAWVHANGRASSAQIDFDTDYLPSIISVGSGRRMVQLGENESASTGYWLAEGCLIYEVKGGKISSGGRSSMEQGQRAIALVNSYAEICYMFCLMD